MANQVRKERRLGMQSFALVRTRRLELQKATPLGPLQFLLIQELCIRRPYPIELNAESVAPLQVGLRSLRCVTSSDRSTSSTLIRISI